MQESLTLNASIGDIEAKLRNLNAILEEYELHDETYCHDYKMLMRLWSRTIHRWRRIYKKCERFSRSFDADFSKINEKLAKYRDKR